MNINTHVKEYYSLIYKKRSVTHTQITAKRHERSFWNYAHLPHLDRSFNYVHVSSCQNPETLKTWICKFYTEEKELQTITMKNYRTIVFARKCTECCNFVCRE